MNLQWDHLPPLKETGNQSPGPASFQKHTGNAFFPTGLSSSGSFYCLSIKKYITLNGDIFIIALNVNHSFKQRLDKAGRRGIAAAQKKNRNNFGFYQAKKVLPVLEATWSGLVWCGVVRPQGFEPRLQAPEACVISLSPRALVKNSDKSNRFYDTILRGKSQTAT